MDTQYLNLDFSRCMLYYFLSIWKQSPLFASKPAFYFQEKIVSECIAPKALFVNYIFNKLPTFLTLVRLPALVATPQQVRCSLHRCQKGTLGTSKPPSNADILSSYDKLGSEKTQGLSFSTFTLIVNVKKQKYGSVWNVGK